MLFKHIYSSDLAQGSYLIGCQATGEAVVVDPRRDVQVYLNEAAANNLNIVAVTETHIHADYLSGSRELAAATGAALYLSDEGDADWKYGFGDHKLSEGDIISLGNVTLRAVHTPGHTPEHLSFLVTDGATASEPGYYLTGDFVFVGDVGRPDLLDEAALGADTRFAGAAALFKSLQAFLTLPDYVQVWPAHGAGSACGKALGAVASTTVGYERLFAPWTSHVKNGDVEGFTRALLAGQPDAPTYFGRMKRQNKAGPPLLKPGTLTRLNAASLSRDVMLIDTRPAEIAAKDAVKGALIISAGKNFATFAAYAVDPERDERSVVLLAADAEQASSLRDKLARVGIDRVAGYITSLADLAREPVRCVAPDAVEALDDPYILDVRTANEFRAGHLPGAVQLHAGRVLWHLDELPRDRPLVTHCQSGARNAAVSSALRAAGFDNVLELSGSYQAWVAAGKPVVEDA